MVNLCPKAADIGPVFWGTPANVNWFRVFTALLHGTPAKLCGAEQRASWVYSAGGPSRWPFGHILVLHAFVSCDCMYCIYYNVYVVRVPVLVIVVLVCVGLLSID